MAMINIACKLPHGLQLRVDGDARAPTLRGSNSSGAIAGYGFTLVDEDFFNAWKKQVTDNYSALKNGLIFESKTADIAKDTAKEIGPETQNGFEPVVPKDEGVEPTEEMKKALDEAVPAKGK